MNIFKSFTLLWWQVGIFKLCLISLGLALGSTWPEFFRRWITLWVTLFIILGLYLGYIWLLQ